jgi:hypothetical protein
LTRRRRSSSGSYCSPRVVVAQCRVEECALLRVPFRRDRLDDLVLAAEVAVQRAVAQPSLGRDVVGGRAVETAPLEARDRGVEDAASPRLAIRVAHLGHQAASATTTW